MILKFKTYSVSLIWPILQVPIDSCYIGSSNSAFLQQVLICACLCNEYLLQMLCFVGNVILSVYWVLIMDVWQASYITGGVYLKPQQLDGLFQYLSVCWDFNWVIYRHSKALIYNLFIILPTVIRTSNLSKEYAVFWTSHQKMSLFFWSLIFNFLGCVLLCTSFDLVLSCSLPFHLCFNLLMVIWYPSYMQTVFATDLQSRSFLQLPKSVGVDFRASYVICLWFFSHKLFFRLFSMIFFSSVFMYS